MYHSGNTCMFICIHSVARVSFSPQNYTVPEGSSVELFIVLDQQACQDITVNVTTMDIGAEGECLLVQRANNSQCIYYDVMCILRASHDFRWCGLYW